MDPLTELNAMVDDWVLASKTQSQHKQSDATTLSVSACTCVQTTFVYYDYEIHKTKKNYQWHF